MDEVEKLRVLLPHWIKHNDKHAEEFREWAEQAGPARDALWAAAQLVEDANTRLQEALIQLGGSIEYHHHHD